MTFLILPILGVNNNSDIPLAKKAKNDASANSKMDAYEATNYLPSLSSTEKEAAETELALPSDMSNLTEVEEYYQKTRILQRHNIAKPLDWHLKTFTWLRKVM